MRLPFLIFDKIAKLNTRNIFLQSLNREIKYPQNAFFSDREIKFNTRKI